jgi:hypothetical protein
VLTGALPLRRRWWLRVLRGPRGAGFSDAEAAQAVGARGAPLSPHAEEPRVRPRGSRRSVLRLRCRPSSVGFPASAALAALRRLSSSSSRIGSSPSGRTWLKVASPGTCGGVRSPTRWRTGGGPPSVERSPARQRGFPSASSGSGATVAPWPGGPRVATTGADDVGEATVGGRRALAVAAAATRLGGGATDAPVAGTGTADGDGVACKGSSSGSFHDSAGDVTSDEGSQARVGEERPSLIGCVGVLTAVEAQLRLRLREAVRRADACFDLSTAARRAAGSGAAPVAAAVAASASAVAAASASTSALVVSKAASAAAPSGPAEAICSRMDCSSSLATSRAVSAVISRSRERRVSFFAFSHAVAGRVLVGCW